MPIWSTLPLEPKVDGDAARRRRAPRGSDGEPAAIGEVGLAVRRRVEFCGPRLRTTKPSLDALIGPTIGSGVDAERGSLPGGCALVGERGGVTASGRCGLLWVTAAGDAGRELTEAVVRWANADRCASDDGAAAVTALSAATSRFSYRVANSNETR